MAWLLASPPMQALGQLSYGFYLWHIFGISIFYGFIGARNISFPGIVTAEFHSWARFGIVILITAIMSALSYGLVERPFLLLRQRLIGGHGLSAPWIKVLFYCGGALLVIHLFFLTDSYWRLW